MENINDISYSPWCFFYLGGQVDASHGNNLENKMISKQECLLQEAELKLSEHKHETKNKDNNIRLSCFVVGGDVYFSHTLSYQSTLQT